MKNLVITALTLLAALWSLADNYLISWSPNPPGENVTSYTVEWRLAQGGPWSSIQTTGTMARIDVGAGLWELSLSARSANGISDRSPPIYITNYLNRILLTNPAATLSWQATNMNTNMVFTLMRVFSPSQEAGLVEIRFLTDQLLPRKIYFVMPDTNQQFYRIQEQ